MGILSCVVPGMLPAALPSVLYVLAGARRGHRRVPRRAAARIRARVPQSSKEGARAGSGAYVGPMIHPSYQQIAHAIRRQDRWSDDEPLRFREEGADLFFLSVDSAHGEHLLGHGAYRCQEHGVEFGPEVTEDAPADAEIGENLRFRYPPLRDAAPAGAGQRCRPLVVFFHGLNARSFTTYVPWAYQLWRATGAAVALY